MIHEEMMGIFASKNPCDNPPEMDFDPDNPTLLAPGGQATLYILGGVPPYTFEILQGSLFFFDAAYIAFPPGYSDTYIKATGDAGASYEPWFSADPTISRIGSYTSQQWISASSAKTNQRWNIDLGSSKTVKQIMIENGHGSGSELDHGIKNFDIQGSNDSNSLAQVDHASDQYWTDIVTGLQAAQHAPVDFDDPQIFDFDNDTAYRYYSLKISDNWGNFNCMGFRHVQFHTAQEKVFKFVTNDPQITVNAPSYALWTARVKCTDSCGTVDNGFLYSSEGKWEHQYDWAGGGTHTPCGNQTFRIIKNGCMFYGYHCNSNEIGQGGAWEADCSGYGGGVEIKTILQLCEGGPTCTYCRYLQVLCWPFP